MSKTHDYIWRRAWRIAAAAGLLTSASAFAQSPPSPTPDAKPSTAAAKPAQDESEALRIRGIVERADDGGVVVQLSKGIVIRVDIGSDAAVYAASRIAIDDLQGGEKLSVRTRASQTAGETTSALEVLAGTTPPPASPAMGANGALKSVDREEERSVLVITEGGADRRLTVMPETTFWRLKPAALGDVKAGMSISVLITREASGSASARRAVFASAPPGAMLPL